MKNSILQMLGQEKSWEIPITSPLRHFSAQVLHLVTHSASLLPVEPLEHIVLFPSRGTSGNHNLHQHQLSYCYC